MRLETKSLLKSRVFTLWVVGAGAKKVATRRNAVGHTTKKGKPCQNDGRGYSGSARRRQFESVDEDRPRTQCGKEEVHPFGPLAIGC